MHFFTALTVALLVMASAAAPARAGLREDLAACRAIADDTARLACFDALTNAAQTDSGALTPDAAEALKREFRFDVGLMTGPFTFRLPVSGDLRISRATAAAREVERVVRRIGKALAGDTGWGVRVTVHGAHVALSRGNPYSGAELFAQAQAGMARSGLDQDRYVVIQGDDATPVLWDDGRIRSVNEHIIVEVTELGAPLTR